MSPSLARRLQRNAQGQLVEAGVVEAPAGDTGDEDRVLPGERMPDGKIAPRYKAFTARISPPPPSQQYRADPGYVAGVDLVSDTRMRAIANHRAWQDRHAEATNRISAWLGGEGLLGPELAVAYAADRRTDQARAQARQAVAAAQVAALDAEDRLAAGVAAWLDTGDGPLPAGNGVVAARAAVEAAEVVAAHVEAACGQARQRLGNARGRVDWAAALARTEQLDTPDAQAAAAWLRAKVSPPPGPTVDPLGWI